MTTCAVDAGAVFDNGDFRFRLHFTEDPITALAKLADDVFDGA